VRAQGRGEEARSVGGQVRGAFAVFSFPYSSLPPSSLVPLCPYPGPRIPNPNSRIPSISRPQRQSTAPPRQSSTSSFRGWRGSRCRDAPDTDPRVPIPIPILIPILGCHQYSLHILYTLHLLAVFRFLHIHLLVSIYSGAACALLRRFSSGRPARCCARPHGLARALFRAERLFLSADHFLGVGRSIGALSY
jgi:hypothetical protein